MNTHPNIKINKKLTSKVISTNSFYILGLTTKATQIEILRRAKEINARLKIDELPEYSGDFNILAPNRNAMAVKEASSQLIQPQNRLLNYVLWFNCEDDELESISEENFSGLLEIWNQPTDDKLQAFFNKRNLVLLNTILLYKQADRECVTKTLNLWEDFLNDKSLWKAFEEFYFTQDEVGCNPKIFKELNSMLTEKVSNMFTELSNINSEPYIYKEFTSKFSHIGKHIQGEVLNPIFEEIDQISSKLEKLDISADGILDDDEKRIIQESIDGIFSKIEEVGKLGLHETSNVKAVRDRAAHAIRIVVLDMHNNLGETEHSIPILTKAITIAGTAGEQEKLKHDVRVLETVQKSITMFEPIFDLRDKKQFQEGLDRLESMKSEHAGNSDLVEAIEERIREFVLYVSLDLFNKGMDSFNDGNSEGAKKQLEKGFMLTKKYLHLFDVSSDYFVEITEKVIPKYISEISSSDFDSVNNVAKDLSEKYKNEFGDRLDGHFLGTSIKCRIYGLLAGKGGKRLKSAPTMQTINGVGSKIYGDTLYFVVLFIPIFPIARYSLEVRGDQYRFFEKLNLHAWQKYWIHAFILIVVVFFLSNINVKVLET